MAVERGTEVSYTKQWAREKQYTLNAGIHDGMVSKSVMKGNPNKADFTILNNGSTIVVWVKDPQHGGLAKGIWIQGGYRAMMNLGLEILNRAIELQREAQE